MHLVLIAESRGSVPSADTLTTRGSVGCGSDAKVGDYFGEYSQQYSGVGGPRALQLGPKFYPRTGNNGAGLNFDGPFEWTYSTPAGAGSSSPTFSLTKAANWGQNADTYNNSGGPGGFRVLQLGAKFYF